VDAGLVASQPHAGQIGEPNDPIPRSEQL